MSEFAIPWEKEVPQNAYISSAPGYEVGKYLDLFEEDRFDATGIENGQSMKYYFFDPTKHGYPEGGNYPLLIFLHGCSNSFVEKVCVNYAGAEYYASPEYQADFRGAYILVPIANEYRTEDGNVQGGWWAPGYIESVYKLINKFIADHTHGVGHKFLLGNSAGATMSFEMGVKYPEFFDALVPVGTVSIPEDSDLDRLEACDVALFFAMGKRDEFHSFAELVVPRLPRLSAMKRCFIFTPEWVKNSDGGIASIQAGIEMGQHCLMNTMQSNLKFNDRTPMDERLPRGFTGWIDEINRGGKGYQPIYTA